MVEVGLPFQVTTQRLQDLTEPGMQHLWNPNNHFGADPGKDH